MAGKGTEVGKNFEELESIISKIKQKGKYWSMLRYLSYK